jgi:hypothetical protein
MMADVCDAVHRDDWQGVDAAAKGAYPSDTWPDFLPSLVRAAGRFHWSVPFVPVFGPAAAVLEALAPLGGSPRQRADLAGHQLDLALGLPTGSTWADTAAALRGLVRDTRPLVKGAPT